jgi:hypothetical protein
MSGSLRPAAITRDQTVIQELSRRNEHLARANQALRLRNTQLERAVSDLTRWMDHLQDARWRQRRVGLAPVRQA